MLDKKIIVLVLDMMCCGNLALITIETTWTIASLKVLPPIAINLETMKVTAKDEIVISPAKKATVVIVMVAGIGTASQPLMISMTAISFQLLQPMTVPFLWVLKLRLQPQSLSTKMTLRCRNRNMILLLSFVQIGNIQHPPLS